MTFPKSLLLLEKKGNFPTSLLVGFYLGKEKQNPKLLIPLKRIAVLLQPFHWAQQAKKGLLQGPTTVVTTSLLFLSEKKKKEIKGGHDCS